MTTNRRGDFELVVLKKEHGDEPKKTMAESEAHYQSLIANKHKVTDQASSYMTVKKEGDRFTSRSENENETPSNTASGASQKHLPLIRNHRLNNGCLVFFAGIVFVLVFFSGGLVFGGINSRTLTRYQVKTTMEAEMSAQLLSNLTTQVQNLKESLQQMQIDLSKSNFLLKARLNDTERDISSVTASTSSLSSSLDSLTQVVRNNYTQTEMEISTLESNSGVKSQSY